MDIAVYDVVLRFGASIHANNWLLRHGLGGRFIDLFRVGRKHSELELLLIHASMWEWNCHSGYDYSFHSYVVIADCGTNIAECLHGTIIIMSGADAMREKIISWMNCVWRCTANRNCNRMFFDIDAVVPILLPIECCGYNLRSAMLHYASFSNL